MSLRALSRTGYTIILKLVPNEKYFGLMSLYIKDIFWVESNLYSPCPNLEGIETHIVVK